MAVKPALNTTILLLISDPIMRAVLQEILQHQGYMILAAGSLGTAVDRLSEGTPDLLITRPYVEGFPGHDAAKYLRTKCANMRVLILGGLLDDDRLTHPEELQKFEVFPKPYSPADLLEKIQAILDTKASH